MRAAIKKGTSNAELALHDDGYSGNGESIFTREAARSRNTKKKTGVRTLTTKQRIDWQERKLRDLYQAHRTERDPVRLLRIERDINAKQNFVEQLWAALGKEQRASRT